MATGYEAGRFETQVDESLHCVICREVLKDPVQCRRNEHHFCRNCITEHLRHSQNCPMCKDPLTVETLARPQRFLANTLSSLKISCENFERGCRKVVELGSLDTHVATCDFSPMPCSNDQCDEILSRRDKDIHEKKVCDFREVKCDYCAQMVLYNNFMQHVCPPRQEIREIKAELREVRSTQDEMLRMMSNLTRIVSNIPQRLEGSHVSSVQELQAEIVVAGGLHRKSVEVFKMTTKTWRTLSEMNERRCAASLVLHQGHVIITGGYSDQYLDSVEELNLVDGQWIEESHIKLPEPSSAHTCVVHQNRLLVIGGESSDGISNTIHEIKLTPPHTSKLLTRMPRAICDHGTVIVNDKVYIIGGSTTGSRRDTTDYVLMFDPATNTCTELNPLIYTVHSMATVTWKENVVVLGGEDKKGNILNEVILYNVATRRQRMLPEMRQKRSGCTAVTIGDNIITMGGMDETSTELRSVECYNFQTNTWTEFPVMAEARACATAVVKYP